MANGDASYHRQPLDDVVPATEPLMLMTVPEIPLMPEPLVGAVTLVVPAVLEALVGISHCSKVAAGTGLEPTAIRPTAISRARSSCQRVERTEPTRAQRRPRMNHPPGTNVRRRCRVARHLSTDAYTKHRGDYKKCARRSQASLSRAGCPGFSRGEGPGASLSLVGAEPGFLDPGEAAVFPHPEDRRVEILTERTSVRQPDAVVEGVEHRAHDLDAAAA